MQFQQYTYRRPNMQEMERQYVQALRQFERADTAEVQRQAMAQLHDITNEYDTMENLAYIRSSIDTTDPFYQEERAFFDEASPRFQQWTTRYYEALLQSPHRDTLEQQFGSQLFELAARAIRTFSDDVLPLIQEENKLTTAYAKLIASAQIDYDGKQLTLAQLGPYVESPNRDVRRRVTERMYQFYADHEETLDTLYDELVQVRHTIATTLGYEHFIELGYDRMNRIDYDAAMVAQFRDEVRTYVVPIATALYERQAKRIGIEDFSFYDEPLQFLSGNATPQGDARWIIENGQHMYRELSKETDEFFSFMMDRQLMDLEAKKGKEAGGYCTYIAHYASPFIFSNFNGTSGDIDVLTHEAGHAFQVYRSRHIGIPEYVWPTHEACEIHSMSMEFFTWPWMTLFFKEQTEKYQFSHLSNAVLFLPYGVAVDEFQHIVYANPSMTPTERKEAWRQLEKTYLPHRTYGNIPFLEAGGLWQRQTHIYEVPFYYIDYTLAQICAFQFWQRARESFDEAWNDYVHLCSLGGSQSFTSLVREANLTSPFERGVVQKTMQPIIDWLESVDDTTL